MSKEKYLCLNCFRKTLSFLNNNEEAFCSQCKTNFTKKELLTKLENLEVRWRYFKIIDHGFEDPSFKGIGNSRIIRKVQCPFCKHIFVQSVEGGCFSTITIPFNCPKCGSYTSIIDLTDKLREK